MAERMMDAVVFDRIGHSEYTKRPVPQIEKSTDVIVKVLIASICGSDLHILSDPPGYDATQGVIVGHELVGEVVEVGSEVTAVKVGQRVILDPNVPCGNCEFCRNGLPFLCENLLLLGFKADGAFAQYMRCPEKVMMPLSEEVPLERAMFAEPLNCAYGGVKRARILEGESVLILGGGPLGLLYAQLFKANGAGKVFVSEVSEERRKLALSLGITRCFNPLEENLVEAVKAETRGYGANLTVDACGMLFNDAIECTRPGGKIILFGQNFSRTQTVSQSIITKKCLTVIGSYLSEFGFPAIRDILENGLIEPEKLITHRVDLEHFEDGLAAARAGKAVKVAVYPWGVPESLK